MTSLAPDLGNILDNSFWTRPQAAIEVDLERYRTEHPVVFIDEPEVPPDVPLPQGPGSWILTRHADILEVSRRSDVFSSADGVTTLDAPPELNEFFNSMITMDDPRHARMRRIVSAGFTPRMLGRLEDSVQEVASTIVDDLLDKGQVDFVVDVAAALPLKIVCDLMGIPESYYGTVFDATNVILGAGDPEYVSDAADFLTALLTAGGTLTEIMTEVAQTKEGGDGTDLTSVLVNAEIEGDKLTHAEIASFFNLLVVAGNETTRHAISWGLTYLTDHPDQRRTWAEDFETIAPTAVEEIVRLASPVSYMRRTATQDVELGGELVKQGDKVCMFYIAGNRDPEAFDDPMTFDVRRASGNQVGFGGPGAHFCLGAHLARREMTVMFRELFQRAPGVVATGDPDPLASSFIHGVKHLPASVAA
ncbi:MAG: cytochrome P450 [Actinomycetota bacterium]